MKTPIEMQDNMNRAVRLIKLSEKGLQARLTSKLRQELDQGISILAMSDERKSYFLHQLAYVREIDEMVTLTRLINQLQLETIPIHRSNLDLIFLSHSDSGMSWTIHRFNSGVSA